MPVFDVTDAPVDPSLFANKLVGAMCEVTFILKHYSIAGHQMDGKYAEANDVFSAQVETVAILKSAPVLARSPYKGRLLRRPQHKPQIPTRAEQINAAEAFVPRPNLGQPEIPPLVAMGPVVLSKPTVASATIGVDAATAVNGDLRAADLKTPSKTSDTLGEATVHLFLSTPAVTMPYTEPNMNDSFPGSNLKTNAGGSKTQGNVM
jgi:hypothetical protein